MAWIVVSTIVILVLVALVGFVVWRFTSVARGATARDVELQGRLDPIAHRIEDGDHVLPAEVEALATSPELRPMLHALLRELKRTELFPERYLSEEAQAESALVYWMLHPNELQAAPVDIELEEKLNREISGRDGVFFVFRYKMPDGHWAGPEWQLGLAGPFFREPTGPYDELAGAFARVGDASGKISPAEVVDWYLGMLKSKGYVVAVR